MSISEARARLPELAQRAMDAPGEPIIIEHRDRKERLVLTTESHLLMLEAMVAELSKARPGGPFRLAGSLQSDLSDAQLEAVLLRHKEARKAADSARLRDLLES